MAQLHDLDRLTRGITREGLDLHSQTAQQLSSNTTPRANSTVRLGWVGAKRMAPVILSPVRSSSPPLPPWQARGTDITSRCRLITKPSNCATALSSFPANASLAASPIAGSRQDRLQLLLARFARRWYISVPVEVQEATQAANDRVGIDLGTKTPATLSEGANIARVRESGRRSLLRS